MEQDIRISDEHDMPEIDQDEQDYQNSLKYDDGLFLAHATPSQMIYINKAIEDFKAQYNRNPFMCLLFCFDQLICNFSTETVKEVTVFTIRKHGSYGTTQQTFYWDVKAWREAPTYDKSIAYTQDEVKAMQTTKLQDRLAYLNKSKEDNIKAIEASQALLNSLTTSK